MDSEVEEGGCMGSYPGHANKRFRLLSTHRWMAQGAGRKGTEEKDNKRITNTRKRGPEHGQGQQDLARHRQGVRFPTELQ